MVRGATSQKELTIDLSPAHVIPQIPRSRIHDCSSIEGWEVRGLKRRLREIIPPQIDVMRCERGHNGGYEFAEITKLAFVSLDNREKNHSQTPPLK